MQPAVTSLFRSYEAEARRAGPDGFFYPFARDAMRNPEAIRERMAADLSRLLDAQGMDAQITTEDYMRLGWRRQQVESHALEAARLLAGQGKGMEGEAFDATSARARDLANEVA